MKWLGDLDGIVLTLKIQFFDENFEKLSENCKKGDKWDLLIDFHTKMHKNGIFHCSYGFLLKKFPGCLKNNSQPSKISNLYLFKINLTFKTSKNSLKSPKLPSFFNDFQIFLLQINFSPTNVLSVHFTYFFLMRFSYFYDFSWLIFSPSHRLNIYCTIIVVPALLHSIDIDPPHANTITQQQQRFVFTFFLLFRLLLRTSHGGFENVKEFFFGQ